MDLWFANLPQPAKGNEWKFELREDAGDELLRSASPDACARSGKVCMLVTFLQLTLFSHKVVSL